MTNWQEQSVHTEIIKGESMKGVDRCCPRGDPLKFYCSFEVFALKTQMNVPDTGDLYCLNSWMCSGPANGAKTEQSTRPNAGCEILVRFCSICFCRHYSIYAVKNNGKQIPVESNVCSADYCRIPLITHCQIKTSWHIATVVESCRCKRLKWAMLITSSKKTEFSRCVSKWVPFINLLVHPCRTAIWQFHLAA